MRRDRAGPGSIDRIFLSGAGEQRPLASLDVFRETKATYAAIGITDLVVHHPRAGDPFWDDPPEILEAIAADHASSA